MLWQKNRRFFLFIMITMTMLMMAGCGNESTAKPDVEITSAEETAGFFDENDHAEAERIAAIFRDIYDEAVNRNTWGNLDTIRRMVARLGENGYVAVDSENQVNMTRPGQVLEFCRAVDEKENDEITIIVTIESGFRKFDLKTENGNVNIVRGYYQYGQNGDLKNQNMVSYSADFWQYTEEGYLIFEGSYFLDEDFALTLSDAQEYTALRVLPLDEKCRELNRRYILPVGYKQNNIFLCDWSEEDFGGLDFYDIFDRFYPMLHSQPVNFAAEESLEAGTVYQIPENIFENVICTYFNVDIETLRLKTKYASEHMAYEYRPRGVYEVEYPDIPYPEVVNYTENQDGTITLNVNAVYPNGNTSKAFSHRTVIRPLNEGGFQYVSNERISLLSADGKEEQPEHALSEEDYNIWWHSDRLTEEEWQAVYGGADEKTEGVLSVP